MLIRRLIPLFALALGACSKGSDSTGTESDADTDADADTDTDSDTCKTDICATYGAAIPAAVGEIVDQAASATEFQKFFAPLVAKGDTAVTAFKMSLTSFISDAYGCTTGTYTGPTMEEAHKGMNITGQEYDDFVALIAGVLLKDGVAKDDVNYCFAPTLTDPKFKATIVGQ